MSVKMEASDSPFALLPNELLSTILAELSTKDLLQLVAVSRRFSSLAARTLHQRLLETASLPDNEVILECYHPSAKISTPYLSCRYLGTAVCDGPAIDDNAPSFLDLRRLYSSFRPVVTEDNRKRRLRYAWSIIPTSGGGTNIQVAADDMEDETAQQEVFLDEGERFSQLCTMTNVVNEGSRRGFFTRHVNISDGVIRVFRDWLSNMLASGDTSSAAAAVADVGAFSSDDTRLLWVDDSKSVGLRFRVTPGSEARGTIFEDEPPVCYNLVYEELLVRTSMLLLAVEEAAAEYVAHSGTDMIIAMV